MCHMRSIAENLRNHFSGLPPGSLVSALKLRCFGSADAVYKFLSREAIAERIERVSPGVYRVNLSTAENAAFDFLDVMKVKAEAFGKDLIAHDKDMSKFRTNGCKSVLHIMGHLVRWVPVSNKLMQKLRQLNSATEDVPKVMAKPELMSITIFPEEPKGNSAINEFERGALITRFDYGVIYGGVGWSMDMLALLIELTKRFTWAYPRDSLSENSARRFSGILR